MGSQGWWRWPQDSCPAPTYILGSGMGRLGSGLNHAGHGAGLILGLPCGPIVETLGSLIPSHFITPFA